MNDKKELEIALNCYIAEKHTQEECIGFIDGFKASKNIENKRISLINLIRKDKDVLISEQFRGRLFGYRQESFRVQYNHNEQSEWISIDDITIAKN
jgi:hypothetical protein